VDETSTVGTAVIGEAGILLFPRDQPAASYVRLCLGSLALLAALACGALSPPETCCGRDVISNLLRLP
jgi:hypothetical protein